MRGVIGARLNKAAVLPLKKYRAYCMKGGENDMSKVLNTTQTDEKVQQPVEETVEAVLDSEKVTDTSALLLKRLTRVVTSHCGIRMVIIICKYK